jgi:hypothetical protein
VNDEDFQEPTKMESVFSEIDDNATKIGPLD